MSPDDPAVLLAALPTMIEADREALVDLCTALVDAPSVNPAGDTRQVAAVVHRALEERGIGAHLERTHEQMPCVLAEVDSGRPGPHLVLNVHLDTMPPGDESAWSVPVWELTRRDGRLYGLGMGNMKGAVAAMVHAVGLLRQHQELWCGRVSFTAVSDEVVFGDNGAAFLLRQHPELAGDALICGEGPGFGRLALGEKGVLWLKVTAAAAAGHSSAVRARISASVLLSAAVTRIDELNGRRPDLPPELGRLQVRADDPGLDLTANVGTIRSGTFIGQIATEGIAEVDLRLPVGISADEAELLVRAAVADLDGVQVTRLKGWDANWTSPDTALVQCWRSATRHYSGVDSEYAIRLPASDASRWRQRGVPAVCFGPQPGFSAGLDDFATEQDVLTCAVLYTATALRFLARERFAG